MKFLWGRLNSNFWFVLALLTAAGLLLFGVMQYLDQIRRSAFTSG